MKKILLLLFVISSLGFHHKEKWDENKSGWTPIMLSIYNGENKKVSDLISNNIDITYRTKGNWALDALFVAIKSNNLFAVKELIKTKKFKKLDSYFGTACLQKNVKIVDLFIDNGVKINKYSENGHSHLMSACISGSPEVVKSLLKNGADINHQRKVDGITALMLATFNGDLKKVEILLKFGPDKTIRSFNDKKALDYIDEIYPRLNISNKTKIKLRDLLSD